MNRFISPLRYPGGKASLYPLISGLLKTNGLEGRDYAEPFAGGCGLALALLFGGHVRSIHINDIDWSIWAFWKSVLRHTEELCERIHTTPITIQEWGKQREIHGKGHQKNPVELGFATLFLNRTNRSGIIKSAGPMGGFDQSGPHKIDCRFPREKLIRRIENIAQHRERIHLTREDAKDFITDKRGRLPASMFFYVDPPYFRRGPSLYTNFYKAEDHRKLAKVIGSQPHPWVVTYDDVPEVRELYRARRPKQFPLQYSLQTKRRATELLIKAKGLRLPRLGEHATRELWSV